MTPPPTSTMLWTAADAAAAANGRALGADWAATGVSINTRTLNPGDLFVALKGPNFDGHAFVAVALQRGAAACLVSRVPEGLPADAPLLLVDDTQAALEDLARVARLNATAKIIAVTGSVGKTSAKEFLRTALGALGPTFATEGNLNNHLGVPLSLACLPADARYGVFEMGMNHAGEIGPLSRMARPDIAIITTVEAVHLEFFASIEGIADAKAEIFEGMSRQGTAILNRDNPQYARLLAAARTQGVGQVLSFGATAGADARLIDLDLGPTGSDVTAEIQGEVIRYTLAVPGRHQALNSLAVLLAVAAAGGDVTVAAQALATLPPVKGRGVRQTVPLPTTPHGGGSLTLIDESYNASPVSVAASAAVLGQAQPGPGGRRIAVLGDMLELGADAPALHAGLAEPLVAADVQLVFTCGPLMRHLFNRLPADRRGAHADSSVELAPLVGAAVRAGDIVMVKGSAGSRMALVVDALKALDTPPPPPSPAVSGS
ncbi:UDP-N-acetylmuramoylalanyl-D-glutamyl-2,6-diaminopimelate--D-alanyl-D-alanine ligase [Nitrospirillum sp. BR 11828]|uniref:UDP-N-acetylmuramoylalanyl-D-glutamyl-2, 6-diaminopimelate--D-alanyl-D-alanine ligase n=1 Tax=Nitrospirillum sp. BR 11828 TaxID=3104325 RepID=UPI002ACA7070|nr:UDP-N-acetylmuramoylalanyl-D-glutamyl-2,6-diaminopimelate--D-alanyl-D-alanine ligase [Nitrospirillum sp. BR 11828]MDZ5647451.1 UDP-N-acetylmuramoylalanyl-D-glutamyl-2,6-diaminopimelate--D-alanyl-D-alanine ligase [Nitrospirillum sp. BR 11828]